MGHPWGQDGYGVRFDWGPAGAAEAGHPDGAVVVVDVLSFTTAVTVAVERGVAVFPAPRSGERAAALAERAGAPLAAGRLEATARRPWSLSPAALREAPVPDPPRLVLPSPNGSAISAAATGTVVAASLRNAPAVARWVAPRYGRPDAPLTVIAAGERWCDGSLRPALEDLLGAGAVLSALGAHAAESPEAATTRAAYEATASVADAVRGCASGLELIRDGFAADVEVAVETGTSDVVPVLSDGAFRPAPGGSGHP